jgi:hypothetical protein
MDIRLSSHALKSKVIMKLQSMLLATGGAFILLLSSCGSGSWNEEAKAEMKSTCTNMMSSEYDKADAEAICTCYLNNLESKYPDANFTPDQNMEEMHACADSYKTSAQKEIEAGTKVDLPLDSLSKDSISGGEKE